MSLGLSVCLRFVFYPTHFVTPALFCPISYKIKKEIGKYNSGLRTSYIWNYIPNKCQRCVPFCVHIRNVCVSLGILRPPCMCVCVCPLHCLRRLYLVYSCVLTQLSAVQRRLVLLGEDFYLFTYLTYSMNLGTSKTTYSSSMLRICG